MKKIKFLKNKLSAGLAMLAAAALLTLLLVLPAYQQFSATGGILHLYPQATTMDMSADGQTLLVNHLGNAVCLIDRETNRIKWQKTIYDMNQDAETFWYVQSCYLDTQGNAFVLLQDWYASLSMQILEYDSSGNLTVQYEPDVDETHQGDCYFGGADEQNVYFVRMDVTSQQIAFYRIDRQTGAEQQVTAVSCERIVAVNPNLDTNSYCVTYADGRCLRVDKNGQTEELFRTEYTLDTGIIPYMAAEENNEIYCSSLGYCDRIYSMKNGKASVYAMLSDYFGMEYDPTSKENITFWSNEGFLNTFCIRYGKPMMQYAKECLIINAPDNYDVISLRDGYQMPTAYVLQMIVGILATIAVLFLIVTGVVFVIGSLMHWHFSVLSKMMFTILPVVTIAFVIMLFTSLTRLKETYYDNTTANIQSIAELAGNQIDMNLINSLTGTVDYENGNFETLQMQMDAITSGLDETEVNLYLYSEEGQSPILYSNGSFQVYPLCSTLAGSIDAYLERYSPTENPDILAGKGEIASKFGNDITVTALRLLRDNAGELKAVLYVCQYDYALQAQIAELQKSLFWQGIILLVVTTALLALLSHFINLSLRRTSKVIEAISGGDLEQRVTKYSKDEIGTIAVGVNHMAEQLTLYIENLTRVTAEKERIGAELNVATQIQADMLPRIFPAFPGRKEFDLYATMNPAKEVGGDFYDFFLIDDDHLALVIADVSGKGVPAALFMVISKTLIKNRAQMGGTPSEILHDVNEQLCEGNEAELFVTVWLGILEISTGKGIAANAGHEHPAIRRAGGQFELVKNKHSPAVAAMEGIRFRQHEFELHPGDCLFVYTDGVAEATDATNTLYGTERMLAALNSVPDASMEELLHTVRQDIDAFVGDAPQFDDVTMLGLHYFGGGEALPNETDENSR